MIIFILNPICFEGEGEGEGEEAENWVGCVIRLRLTLMHPLGGWVRVLDVVKWD